MSFATAYVGLGANLGDPAKTLGQALETLAQTPGVLSVRASRLYRSDPVEAPGPAYINAVTRITTTLAPLPLLEALRTIETQFGRERHFRNAPRTLDLDLLTYDKLEFSTPTLTVPHPRMHLRAFVIKPLIELAGQDAVINGQTLEQWLAACLNQPCVLA